MISFVWGMVMTAALSAVAQRRALKSSIAQVATVARLNSAGSVPLRTTLVFGVAAAVETVYEVPALHQDRWLAGVAIVYAFGLAATAVWHRVLEPARSRVPGWSMSSATLSDVLRAVAVRSVPTYLWVAVLGLLVLHHQRAHLVAASFVGYAVLTAVLGGALMLLAYPSRRLDEDEQRRVALASQAFGLEVRRTRVLCGLAGRSTNAYMAGVVPGFQTILLTERLIDTFDDAALSAVLAHEVCHARRGHLLVHTLLRLVITLGVSSVALLMIKTPTHGEVWLGLLLVVLLPSVLTLVVGGVRKRRESDADRFAVVHVGEVPVRQALTRLLRAHPQLEHRTWWQSLRDGHPDLTTRLCQVSEVS